MMKVFLIGLDAADWGLVAQKIARGELPHLGALAARGARGPLRSLAPFYSPAVWGSIATGKCPFKHGVIGFTEPDAGGVGLRPYDRHSMHCATLWNILSHVGKASHVVGWWTTAPVEPICGSMVADSFHVAREPLGMPWPVPARSVYPSNLSDELGSLRVHPQMITEQQVMQLIPRLFEVDPSEDWRIASVATILARDLTHLNVTKHMLKTREWDFSSVYFIGLDHLSHMLMRLRSPALEGSAEWDREIYGEVIDRAYSLYDEWIGELVTLLGPEVNIGVLSDHGFYWDHRRQRGLGIEQTAPCREHAPRGCLFFAGPAIRKQVIVERASILDICPTLLTLFSLPVGRDMDGRILESMLINVDGAVPAPISSWDLVCQGVRQSEPERPSTEETLCALDQLRALGYLADLPKEKQAIVDEQECDRIYHHGLAYLDDRRVGIALPLLEEAFRRRPERSDIGASLAGAWALAGRRKRAAAVLRKIVRIRRKDAAKARRELVTLEKQLSGRSFREMQYEEAYRFHCVSARAMLDETSLTATMLLADWFSAAPHCERLQKGREQGHSAGAAPAKQALCALAEQHPDNILFLKNAGSCCLDVGEAKEAKRYFERVVAWDPDDAGIFVALACAEFTLSNYDAAERHAREAIALDVRYSPGWLVLARVLVIKKHWVQAKVAARIAARTLPDRKDACELLAQIASEGESDHSSARRYRRVARRAGRMFRKAPFYGLRRDYSKVGKKPHAKCSEPHDQANRNDQSASMIIASELAGITKAPANNASFRTPVSSSTAPSVIVVTGLPRSGTSLVAQMLSAGGVAIFEDGQRDADEHNPMGYFEHSLVRSLPNHPQWICMASGRAVKVVIPLLWYLPEELDCQILFVERDLSEVLESQSRMLRNAGHGQSKAEAEELAWVYRYQLAKTRERLANGRSPWLVLQHQDLIEEPGLAAERIAHFLQRPMDCSAMARVVRPELYRSRNLIAEFKDVEKELDN